MCSGNNRTIATALNYPMKLGHFEYNSILIVANFNYAKRNYYYDFFDSLLNIEQLSKNSDVTNNLYFLIVFE